MTDCYMALKNESSLQLDVFAGGSGIGVRVPSLNRSSRLTGWIGAITRHNPYYLEQVTFALAVYRRLVLNNYDVVYFADITLGNALAHLRKRLGGTFRLLYMNGGGTPPGYLRGELVQLLTNNAYDEAIAAGEDVSRLCLLPHALFLRQHQVPSMADQINVRRRLQLPLERKIILAVGMIDRSIKRLDYLIRELAAMDEPRPLLVGLGQFTDETKALKQLALRHLGKEGQDFIFDSVPADRVGEYYQAANLFALASLREGFGLAFVEAASYGLPTLAHNSRVMEFVIGNQSELADFTKPGELTRLLTTYVCEPIDHPNRLARHEKAVRRFDWLSLKKNYINMFHAAAQLPLH